MQKTGTLKKQRTTIYTHLFSLKQQQAKKKQKKQQQTNINKEERP